MNKLYDLLLTGRRYNTIQICDLVYGSDRRTLSRVGARINDIFKKYGAKFVDDRRLPNGDMAHGKKINGVYSYQMVVETITITVRQVSTVQEIADILREHKEKQVISQQLKLI